MSAKCLQLLLLLLSSDCSIGHMYEGHRGCLCCWLTDSMRRRKWSISPQIRPLIHPEFALRSCSVCVSKVNKFAFINIYPVQPTHTYYMYIPTMIQSSNTTALKIALLSRPPPPIEPQQQHIWYPPLRYSMNSPYWRPLHLFHCFKSSDDYR